MWKKRKRTVSKAHVCWNKKSVGHLERAPCTWAPKPWCPKFVGVFLLIKVRALIKPENIESTEIHWKPVRIVRLSDPLQKRAVLKWHQKKTPKKVGAPEFWCPFKNIKKVFCFNLKNQHQDFDFLFFLTVSMCPQYFLILSKHCQHKHAFKKTPELWCLKCSRLTSLKSNLVW